MQNAKISAALSEMADILDLLGENTFKVRAFRRAAQIVDTLPRPAAELWREGELTKLPGIGERIAHHVGELVEKGACPEHDRLARRVPPGVLEMMRLEGVGPKTAAAAWRKLRVVSVDALEAACSDGSLAELPRLGPARARAILAAIERHRARGGRVQLHRALPYAESLLARLRAVKGVEAAEAAGSLRRRKETVGDVDLLVAARDAGPVMRAFASHEDVAEVLAQGETRSAVRLESGLHVDLRVVEPDAFGAALHYFTGSKAHNVAVRARALKMGLKLNEYGLWDRAGKRMRARTEEEIFRALGLPFIPPELREDEGELEAAEKGELPRLVEEEDVVGDLHVHSDASSDGHSTLEALRAEGRRLGRRYLAITDHSRSRPLGLDAAALAAHAARIRALDARGAGPRLLAGVEVDILASGELDLPRETLAGLDLVVASVHARLDAPRPRMTERLVRALRSGAVDVLGHPSGRQLGARDPSAFDLAAVLEAARDEGVALEVNAMPERLDLTDAACRAAKRAGVAVAISSDAHDASHLANLRYGVWVARRGWLTKADVVDAAPLAALRRRLGRRHRMRSGATSGASRAPGPGSSASHPK